MHRDLDTKEERGGKDTFEWLQAGISWPSTMRKIGREGSHDPWLRKGSGTKPSPSKDVVGHWFESSSGSHYRYIWEVDGRTIQFWLNDRRSNMSFRVTLVMTLRPSPAHGNGRATVMTS
jgi:hypothetical protein